MSDSPNRRRGYGVLFWCVMGVLLMLALYIAAYYGMAQKFPDLGVETYEGPNHVMYAKPDYFPHEPAKNAAFRRLFTPIHLIDRTIRKDRWRA